MAGLILHLNIHDLFDFLKDPVNEFLVNYFAQKDLLEISDPDKDKPTCRKAALENLISMTSSQQNKQNSKVSIMTD